MSLSDMTNQRSIGYGTSTRESHLMFNGDERQYEQWETRFLGYLKIKKLKELDRQELFPSHNGAPLRPGRRNAVRKE